jgi:hypothetical protein
VLCLQGKVRDTYDLGDRIVVITTDRQSAFDRLLASIPFKGQVLNQTAAWWFTQTRHIVDNAVLDVPDPNVVVMQKCSVFPVEFVVRGFMTGEGSGCGGGGGREGWEKGRRREQGGGKRGRRRGTEKFSIVRSQRQAAARSEGEGTCGMQVGRCCILEWWGQVCG